MADLISREDAIGKCCGEKCECEREECGYTEACSEVMRLESLPSAETVQGEWIEVEDDYDTVYWECSNCEDAFFIEVGTPKDNNYNFCPNCGARMYKGDDSE